MMLVSSVLDRIKRARHLFATDSLFRNATYLTASTVVMALLGFLFWIFVAHMYTPSQVGVASALISISTLISNLSLLGLNSGMVRFLSHAKNKSADINAATIVIASVTVIAAAAYAFIGTHLSGHITLLGSSWAKLAFIVLMMAVSLNSLTDSVFIASRRGEYHTAGYATLGIVKLILPLVLVPFGSTGIFGAYILAMVASLLLSYYLMWRGCDYRPFTRPNWGVIKQTRTYAAHNYAGVVIGGLPAQLMPIFIIRNIGESSVAYFSMAWTMVNLIYIVPSAAMQSFLAEASHNPEKKNEHIKRAVRMLALLLIPMVAFAVIIAPFMLSIFGTQYKSHATVIFQLFALSTFFVTISTVGSALLNIERKTWGIVGMQIANFVATFGSVFWLVRYGLSGIGLAMVLGNIATCIVFFFLYRRLQHDSGEKTETATKKPLQDVRQVIQDMLRVYDITQFRHKKFTNGSSSVTLLIEHPAGKSVLRIYKPGISYKKIEAEINFMEYLAGRGVLVPRIIKNGQGERIFASTVNGVERRYVLMEYIAGEHPSAYSMPLLTEMATQQAQIHLGGLEYDNVQERPGSKGGILAAAIPHGYSHFDFDASNILVEDDRISSVLDFEGMRYGPVVSCIYFTLKNIYDLERDVNLPLAYIGIYQKTRRLRLIERSILALLLSLHYRNVRFLRALTV